MSARKMRLVFAAVLLALLIAIGMNRYRRRGEQRSLAGSAGSGARTGEATAARRARRGGAPPRLDPLAARSDSEHKHAGLWMLQDPNTPVVVADTVVLTRFPLDSHTLDAQQVDLLEPNRRWERPGPVKHRDRTVEEEEGLQVLLSGDKLRLIGDDSIHATLAVTRGGTRIPVRVVSALAREVEYLSRKPLGVDVPLGFRDDGAGGLSADFAPARTVMKDFEGIVHIEVEYDIGGAANGYAWIEVYVQPAGLEPARFTGKVREALVDGSLWFYVEIEVQKAGPYVLDASVFDAAGQPVGSMRAKQELAVGTWEVAFRLFGRIVYEKGVDGPFTLDDVRGFLFLPGQDPDRLTVPDLTEPYRSQPYVVEDFSDEEWWDEHKQQHVDQLLDAARTGAHELPTETIGDKEGGWQPRF